VGENLSEFAEERARAVLCGQAESGNACNTCKSCRKAMGKIHPDLIKMSEYKVGELRNIVADSFIRPNDGEFKVYIFTDADTMSPLCQNTLLKFTEEPPDYVRIIFTVKSQDLLLDTIKSRLAFINVNAGDDAPPENAELTETAKAFVAALARNNEYDAAVSLSGIKKRDDLSKVLDLISAELRNSMHSFANYAQAQKFLLGCADDLKVNPNIALTCAYITAGICERLCNHPALPGHPSKEGNLARYN
jgi:DNA polymerase III delta prime subunit